jgi:hypothetical protein
MPNTVNARLPGRGVPRIASRVRADVTVMAVALEANGGHRKANRRRAAPVARATRFVRRLNLAQSAGLIATLDQR